MPTRSMNKKKAAKFLEQEEYVVEAILEERTRNGVVEFLIKWEGYSKETWEPESNLRPTLVSRFRKKNKSIEEYVVEEILAERTRNGVCEFQIKWEGYSKPTWEPESNLSAKAIREFRQKRSVPDAKVCAVCGDGPDGVARACEECQRPMHHFCANDVCANLNLVDEDGSAVVEFPNGACYCSGVCFHKRERLQRERIDRPGLASKGDDVFATLSDSDSACSFEDEPKKQASVSNRPKPQVAEESSLSSSAKKASTKRARENQPEETPRKAPTSSKALANNKAVELIDPLLGKIVAFCAEHEPWMPKKLYKDVIGFYLPGRIFKAKGIAGQRSCSDVYEVRWTYTQYQSAKFVHRLTRIDVERGINNFNILSGSVLSSASWRSICDVPVSEKWQSNTSLDDYVLYEGSDETLLHKQLLPENLEQVEQIKNMDFQTMRKMNAPSDLYVSADGSTESSVHPMHRAKFVHSASSSFFAYLPVSFWKQVVAESNKYAGIDKSSKITLEEMMKFLGILFYMAVVEKGEYSNYWGEQVEARVLGTNTVGLEQVMSLKRFKFIRKNLCFRHDVSDTDLKVDPVARIRPLLNILKHTCNKYVIVGRDIAVDESSIACRSKFGRHLIVFNSTKPTGKYHFKIYVCCDSESWVMVGFRLHCSAGIESRLQGVLGDKEREDFAREISYSSEIRKIVLEVTKPLHGTKRIVNTDNFYTSVQLLMSLRQVGLYGRGTIRTNSKHFPKAHMFSKNTTAPRGSMMQGVSLDAKIVAASWMDGNAVNIISNADSSDYGEVTRLVGKISKVYPAPRCVAEYNKNMQGVDRMDQLRSKFSICDGHSFKKWHKKLAMAFIDIARVNAYATRKLALGRSGERNEHQDFVIELASQLISGSWSDGCDEEGMFLYDPPNSMSSPGRRDHASQPPTPTTPTTPTTPCLFTLSKIVFPDATRGKRGCKICKFEGRYNTEKTVYCQRHGVCLCSNVYPRSEKFADALCPHTSWTCWQKFHDYYLPQGVFNQQGRVKRSSPINKARRQLMSQFEMPATQIATATTPVTPALD